jgi:hypothetical protein
MRCESGGRLLPGARGPAWDHHLRDYVCDTLRKAMTGGQTPIRIGSAHRAGYGTR